jgi:hypothetical protein
MEPATPSNDDEHFGGDVRRRRFGRPGEKLRVASGHQPAKAADDYRRADRVTEDWFLHVKKPPG